MPDFEPLNPAAPATVENVALAVAALARFDEAEISELVTQGRLSEVFPFRLARGAPSEDTRSDADVPQASALPLTDEAFAKLLKSSMRDSGASAARVPLHAKQSHGLLRGVVSLLSRDQRK